MISSGLLLYCFVTSCLGSRSSHSPHASHRHLGLDGGENGASLFGESIKDVDDVSQSPVEGRRSARRLFVQHRKTRAGDGALGADWGSQRLNIKAVLGGSVKEKPDQNEGYDLEKQDDGDERRRMVGMHVEEERVDEDDAADEKDDSLTGGDGRQSDRFVNLEMSIRKSKTAEKDGTTWKKGEGVETPVQFRRTGVDGEMKREDDVENHKFRGDSVAELRFGAEKVKRKKLDVGIKEKNDHQDQDDNFNAVLKNALKASDDAEMIVKSGFGQDQENDVKSKEIDAKSKEIGVKSKENCADKWLENINVEKKSREDMEAVLKDAKEERGVAEKSVDVGLKKYQEIEAKLKNEVEGKIVDVGNETAGEELGSKVTLSDREVMIRTSARRKAGATRVEGGNKINRENDEVQEPDVEVGTNHVTDDKNLSVDGKAELKPLETEERADDKVKTEPIKTGAEKSNADLEAKLKASSKDAKKASDDASEIANTGAIKDQEIEAKLKNIETMQKTIKQTLDNTTMSLNEIQKLKSELDQKVLTVNAEQEAMEGTREVLKAAVSKIADVGKDLLATRSKLTEGRDATLHKVVQLESKESELSDALGKTAEHLVEEEKKNVIQGVELAGEKSAIAQKAKILDEEEESQINRTRVIDHILNKTKHLLEEKEEDDLDEAKEAEESLKTAKKKIVTEEKEIRKEEKVAKNIKADLKTIAQKVALQGKAESEKLAAAKEENEALSSEVKSVREEKEDLEKMVKEKTIELEAKEKALDAKVIDTIVNKTAELFDKKVAVLEEDLQRKIDESVKNVNASKTNEEMNGAGKNETKVTIVSKKDSSNATTQGKISGDGSLLVKLPSSNNASGVNGTKDGALKDASSVVTTSSPVITNYNLLSTTATSSSSKVANASSVLLGGVLVPGKTPSAQTSSESSAPWNISQSNKSTYLIGAANSSVIGTGVQYPAKKSTSSPLVISSLPTPSKAPSSALLSNSSDLSVANSSELPKTNAIASTKPTSMEAGPDLQTSVETVGLATTDATQNASHMVFPGGGGGGGGGNSTDGAEQITVSQKKGGEELEIALGGNEAKNVSENVVVDGPKQIVMLRKNVSKIKNETVEGKTNISEYVHIVNKPETLTKEDQISLENMENSFLQQETATTMPEVAASIQETGDGNPHRSAFVGTAGWVFIGLFVCVVCVLIIVGAIFVARRRYAKNAQNKERPHPRGGNYSPPSERPIKKVPLSQRVAAGPQNRTGYYMSAGYVDDMSRMPEASDMEIGTRQTMSLNRP